MKTNTNWEDNQLMREAAKHAQAEAKRTYDIHIIVAEALTRLHTALREDFHLTEEEIVQRIQEQLP
jgi:hypothetical protein